MMRHRNSGQNIVESFQWNTWFVTGFADVDDQHRRLVDLINQFGTLVTRPEGASIAEIDAVFGEVVHYTQYHFAEEEALMLEWSVDPSHVDQHAKQHADFLDEITRLRDFGSDDHRASAQMLLDFLTHWLAYHILGTDQVMARQMAAIRSGCRPADACRATASASDPAMEALLAALKGLFQQMSERNRELEQAKRSLEARVAERTDALTNANRRLEDLAYTDTLTNLRNRRFALRTLALEWEASLRDGTPLACMMIDADRFKDINDLHGHEAGDVVLRALSTQLRSSVRSDDVVCRLGGDEFLIICARTPVEGALKMAEKVRRDVARLRVPAGAGEWRGSICVGVAARTEAMNGLEDLLKAADRGVYVAKSEGRNCVATSGSRTFRLANSGLS